MARNWEKIKSGPKINYLPLSFSVNDQNYVVQTGSHQYINFLISFYKKQKKQLTLKNKSKKESQYKRLHKTFSMNNLNNWEGQKQKKKVSISPKKVHKKSKSNMFLFLPKQQISHCETPLDKKVNQIAMTYIKNEAETLQNTDPNFNVQHTRKKLSIKNNLKYFLKKKNPKHYDNSFLNLNQTIQVSCFGKLQKKRKKELNFSEQKKFRKQQTPISHSNTASIL